MAEKFHYLLSTPPIVGCVQELQAVHDQKVALQTSSTESFAEQVETRLSAVARNLTPAIIEGLLYS